MAKGARSRNLDLERDNSRLARSGDWLCASAGRREQESMRLAGIGRGQLAPCPRPARRKAAVESRSSTVTGD
jgi:hypothetical protein